MKFWLGVHRPHWLARTDAPLFVSRRQLTARKRLPKAVGPWALDSGGFTEVSMYGTWKTTEAEYVDDVLRFRSEVGLMEWAAPRDWMCEPHIIARTGLSVREHQERTVQDYLNLRDKIPVVPVLQGWTRSEYQTCAELYESAGVRLSSLPLVAIGSVCRRQQTQGGREVIQDFYRAGLRLHAFGMKSNGLKQVAWMLESSDSLAWSYRARKAPGPMVEGCTHKTCTNCLTYALRWRENLIESIRVQQPDLGLPV